MAIILITDSKEFQTAMIESYPGILKGNQVKKVPLGYRQNAFVFTGLEHEVAADFLKKYKPMGHTVLCHIDS